MGHTRLTPLTQEGGEYDATVQTPPAHSQLLTRPDELTQARLNRSQEACLLAAADWVPNVMRCKNPYINSTLSAYGCGQCLPCRINKRREWTHRILLEALQYKENCFVTLTYGGTDGTEPTTLIPEHPRNFLKRIRKSIEPRKLRFYLVGEYGDKTDRPHYHIALFNHPTCSQGNTQYNRHGIKCCSTCQSISEIWGHGHILLGRLEPHSAAYIAGYVTKKMTRTDDIRLGNRHPEFARMSLRPGIGYDAMHEYASALLQYANDEDDVPAALRHGRKLLPLGRYLTRTARKLTGRPIDAPQTTIQKAQERLLDLQADAINACSGKNMGQFRREVFKNLIIEKYKGKVASLEARNKIYRKAKPL